ncbi:hypothetical protein NIES4075_57390 [Tolypothrix sp. NIES-4075]|uniref:HD domain-containing protein n=1 Tax=Tolypothrix sp. NIES-4075 TaxID=2005459 RepID=UPI000B5CE00D|nr:HD domain-containing protein [Tolypothrix sp. NIES-4075]GAX44720.1 hypothetical protein NIES4075_57390 [Tolypothrix sp. NIES-4075]
MAIADKDKILQTRIGKILEIVGEKYDNGDPGHDISHVLRVMRMCEFIGEQESVNLSILVPAALLHDVVNIPKDHPDRLKASKMAAEEAEKILEVSGYDRLSVLQICDIIVEHSYSLAKTPSSLESAILQDADKLDALGAIGVLRMVTCGCRLGAAYYDISEPFVIARELNDRAFTIDHLFVKLLKLPETMNTRLGRIEAQKRVKFMESFLEQLKKEIVVSSTKLTDVLVEYKQNRR